MRRRPKIGLRSLAIEHEKRLVDRTIVRRGGEDLAKKKPKSVKRLT